MTQQVGTVAGPLTILDQVSFSINPGEVVAVVGASGSGKSTLLGLLAGLDTPSSGRLLLDGTDVFALSEDQRARLRSGRVGFVFQSFQLLGSLTALENVMLPMELTGQKDARSTAQHLLERVGLGPRVQHYPRHLSGGEQQRVAIARAFAGSPRLLFADEPTGNLDTRTGKQIIDLLFELNQASGTTLVLVTHDASLAARCQRRLHLDAGRLVNDERNPAS